MDELELMTLEFDDGLTVECAILGVFDCDDKEYIALEPQDGSDDIYLYGYREVGEDEFELVDIEDDAEYAKVEATFNELMEHME